MELKLSTILFLSFLQSIMLPSTLSDDKLCKDAVKGITKKQLKGVTECTKQMSFKNNADKQKRMTCVMKCVFLREGIIGTNGYTDPIGSLTFITINLPDHVQEHSRKVLISCLGAAVSLDPTEETCKSYEPLVKCGLSALNQFCNGPRSKNL